SPSPRQCAFERNRCTMLPRLASSTLRITLFFGSSCFAGGHALAQAVTNLATREPGGGNRGAPAVAPSVDAAGSKLALSPRSPPLRTGRARTIEHVFVTDLASGTFVHASTSTFGVPGNLDSNHPSISGTGRFVAFQSLASNLVSGDLNSVGPDIFVKD